MAGKLGSVWSVEGRRLIAIQLAELLCYLHGKGCACGYLTPSQLFVLPGDTLFANILLLERSPSRGTRSGQWIRYIAPELLTGEKASRQSDLYSLGMLFYHLFTGHPPYAEQDSEVLKSKQLAIFPVKARKLNPDIPACIEELIHELIQKDARLRPKDAQQIVALLKNGTERPTALPRLRAPLMGRDIELANFRSLFEEHVAGKSAHFLAIRGVSGIGKTFLMERFGIITKLRGAVSYTVSHHRNSGIFAAFRQLVHKAPAHKESESKIGMRKLNDERSKTLNPDLFFQNLLRFLGEFSAGRPVVLCANDLQWMDEGSLEVYKRLFREESCSILVIANYRTDEASENWKELRSWLSESQVFTEFDLKGLLHQEVVELVTNLLGCPPPEELDTKIVNQCAGNPFYIYEFLRFLQKKRGLFYQSGHWEWQATLDEPRIPSTVAETIQNRLKELEEQKLRTLQYLSVLQKPTKIDLFSRMVRMPISDLNQNLDFLESLDFVSVSSDLDEPTAFLSHDWLGQVIRSNLSPNPRQRIHQRIATTLEKEFVETLDPILGGPTVYHFLEAGDRAKTRKYLATAISWYEEAHLYKEAARLLETALERSVVSAKSWNWARKAVELFYLSGQLDKSIHLSERLLRFAELPDKKKTFIYSLLGPDSPYKGSHQVPRQLTFAGLWHCSHFSMHSEELTIFW